MELFGKSKQAWLQQFLDLPNGIPSHDTFGRVFARLNPKHFHQCFLSWTQAVSKLTQGAVVSLDGKTVKASLDRATELSPVHVVSAWCSQNGGLVMGQLKAHSKSNEITAIPELLKLLAIKGCIVTIDAIGMPESHRQANPRPTRRLSRRIARSGNRSRGGKAIRPEQSREPLLIDVTGVYLQWLGN